MQCVVAVVSFAASGVFGSLFLFYFTLFFFSPVPSPIMDGPCAPPHNRRWWWWWWWARLIIVVELFMVSSTFVSMGGWFVVSSFFFPFSSLFLF